MNVEVNSIITLDDIEKYIVLKETTYEDKTYFLTMGLDEDKNVIPSKVEIIYEIILDDGTYVEVVKEKELLQILTQLFKEQI